MLVDTFVPVDAKEEIQARFDKIVKRSLRIGFPTPTILWGQIVEGNANGPYSDFNEKDESGSLKWQHLQIDGAPLKIGDWTLVASIDPLDTKDDQRIAFFRPVPDAHVPDEWRETDPSICQHCNAVRYRTETFLIRNGDDYKQVGRQCIKDFLGHNPDVITNYLNFLREMFGWFSDEDEGGWRGFTSRVYWTPTSLIQLASVVVAVDGFFVSRKKEREAQESENYDVVATASNVMGLLHAPRNEYEREFHRKYEAANQERVDTIFNLTIEELDKLNRYEDNDWKSNLWAAWQAREVGYNQLGILVSGVLLGLRRDEQAQKEREEYLRRKANGTKEPQFVGEVGQRITANVTVTDIREFESNFGYYGGTSYLVTMLDTDGNVMKWFASNPPESVEKDATLTVTGTVKKHDEWKGQKQTVLTRCKVKENK